MPCCRICNDGLIGGNEHATLMCTHCQIAYLGKIRQTDGIGREYWVSADGLQVKDLERRTEAEDIS